MDGWVDDEWMEGWIDRWVDDEWMIELTVGTMLDGFRHWQQICDDLKCSFSHTSTDFTLEKIIALGLDEHADKLCEISGAASKELLIEQVSTLLLANFLLQSCSRNNGLNLHVSFIESGGDSQDLG